MQYVKDTSAHLEALDAGLVIEAMREGFAALASGRALQPPQMIVPTDNGGDVISYPSVLLDEAVYALKLSPYIPQDGDRPIITAWTMLMSLTSGTPLALLDSKALTVHRTAATSALAVDLLSSDDATNLSIVGHGPAGREHLRYIRRVRPFTRVRVHTRHEVAVEARQPGVEYTTDIGSAVFSDVIALCTSAAGPVIDAAAVRAGGLITSISTNAPEAHEIDPASLARLNVYRDYRPEADDVPEFRAAEALGWSKAQVLGDLPALISSTGRPGKDPTKASYFRSIGQGIEDAIIARLVLRSVDRSATDDEGHDQ